MPPNDSPVVLELAPLPREQIGPFLVLGLDKGADDERIEANWAQRVIWARKNQFSMPLEDINWAREVIRDPERRLRADLNSLNPDTSAGVFRELAERYGMTGGPTWQPRDREKALADFTPPTEIPDVDQVLPGIAVPEVPGDLPMVAWLIDNFIREPIDPWNLTFAEDSGRDRNP
jgi:hypothetical protein